MGHLGGGGGGGINITLSVVFESNVGVLPR